MDLLSSYESWPAQDAHGHEKLTFPAAIFMWATVLIPYLGLAAILFFIPWLRPTWTDVALFSIVYLFIGFGVTIGYHRMLAHKSFTSYTWIEGFWMVLGCMAMQGPPISWTATHRRHHQTSDHEGDPHSPHLDGNGIRGVAAGLWHAHTGWLMKPRKQDVERSVKDLVANPTIRFVDKYYFGWLALSVIVSFGLGLLVHRTIAGGLAMIVYLVVLRIGLMHHATWSVNSICHFFGYRSFQSGDESRNNPVIAAISLGEGWHNNHHAFPTSARHGLKWYEFDPSYVMIAFMERVGLAWDVRRPSAGALEAKKLQTS